MREAPPGKNRRLQEGMILLLLAFALPAYQNSPPAEPDPFAITEARMCSAVDENRRPLKVSSEFPAGTQAIHCWFSWENAKPNTQILARWYYTSEDFHILDFPVTLTRKSNYGVVSLQMPKGKNLLSGSYRVDFSLLYDKKILRSVSFTVLEPGRPSTGGDKPESGAAQPASAPSKAPPSGS